MIKAIETVYKGYRFRSRLEARWAVFFDEMGIEYQYEPEGFETPFGWYLPDFYLPKMHAWVEAKGGRELTTKERRQLKWVCANTYSLGLVVMGDPVDCGYPKKENTIAYFSYLDCDRDIESYYSFQDGFLFLPKGSGVVNYFNGGPFFHLFDEFDYDENCSEFKELVGKLDFPMAAGWHLGTDIMSYIKKNGGSESFIKTYHDCATKARQARFEHGESPNGL